MPHLSISFREVCPYFCPHECGQKYGQTCERVVDRCLARPECDPQGSSGPPGALATTPRASPLPTMAFRDTPRASGGDETMDGLSCPHHIEKSAHISVHIHVDRNMDSVYFPAGFFSPGGVFSGRVFSGGLFFSAQYMDSAQGNLGGAFATRRVSLCRPPYRPS